MDSIVEATNGATDRARHALLNGSAFARAAEDPARARAMLERLLRETEDESSSLSQYFADSYHNFFFEHIFVFRTVYNTKPSIIVGSSTSGNHGDSQISVKVAMVREIVSCTSVIMCCQTSIDEYLPSK